MGEGDRSVAGRGGEKGEGRERRKEGGGEGKDMHREGDLKTRQRQDCVSANQGLPRFSRSH